MKDYLEEGTINDPLNEYSQLNNLYKAYLKAQKNCPESNAGAVFFGEMLHALTDTYSHADTDNDPYDATMLGLGIGHGLNDSDPDYTFNHYGYGAIVNKLFPGSQPNADNGGVYWKTNQDRTLKAEQDIFNQFLGQKTWALKNSASFSQIGILLIAFNITGESEQYDFSWNDDGRQKRSRHDEVNHGDVASINSAFSQKLEILNNGLKELGFDIDLKDPQWAYNKSLASKNRNKYLSGLHCDDYPGVILPSERCERSKKTKG